MMGKTKKNIGLMGVDAALLVGLGLAVILVINPCNGELYKVGDSDGWTTIGHVDYKTWASTKTFHIGDVILFKYSPQFHNVMQVNHIAYKACNASFPIATHTSGNDSITITSHGHHFFLCGVPGHCQNGQKVDINVVHSSSAFAPTPLVASASGAPPPANKAGSCLPSTLVSFIHALSAIFLALLVH